MQIKKITKSISGGKVTLSAHIESESYKDARLIFFTYPEKYADHLPETADPFLPAILVPAMLAGEDVEIIPPVSKKLFRNQLLIQDIFSTWHSSILKKINVKANDPGTATPPKASKTATFFSLGVDSMYSMLKHLTVNNPPRDKELNSLIFMKGLELPLSTYSKGQDKDLIIALRKLASHYNLELITGETNIRDVFPVSYEKYYFGPCLAATALSLSNGFKNIIIPSSSSYADLFPDPSNPLTDPLWSNEATAIIHDGSEKERSEKVADMISYDQYALDNLRVCVKNEGGKNNCCRCWKCIRTMVTLEIVGHLKDSKAFPLPLPGNYAKELRTYDPDSMVYAKENLKLARKYGKKNIEKKLSDEIRIGTLDLYREGRPVSYLFGELAYYFSVKLGRALRILDF